MEIDAIKDNFLQPFKAQGAVDVDDYGFVISTKFMSKPGTQFTIRRYAFQAMQNAFEAHGIPFAQPSVRVVVDGKDTELSEPIEQAAVTGAAAAAVSKTPIPK